MSTRFIALLCCVVCLLCCERKAAPPILRDAPIRVPVDSVIAVHAQSLGKLLDLAGPLATTQRGKTALKPVRDAIGFPPASRAGWTEHGADLDSPALFFCDQAACALRASGTWSFASSDDELTQIGESNGWVVRDRSRLVLLWGPADEESAQSTLERWREPSRTGPPPVIHPADDVSGRLDPGPALRSWGPKTQRARELVERVRRQANTVTFRGDVEDGVIDLALDVVRRPGEPRFVDELGTPTADLPGVAGLVGPGVLGVARLSGDPETLWTLGRSLLSVEQRGDFDEALETLRGDAAVDVEKTLVDNVTGHVFVVAYGLDESEPGGWADWFLLRATRDAVLIPIRDADPVRRLFDAWTQLSRGRLHVQQTRGERLQWAWIEEGELRWSAILGKDYLLFVDSNVAMEHATRWEKRPEPLSGALVKRGVERLVQERARSGLYLDLAALRTVLAEDAAAWFPSVDAVTFTEDSEGSRIRLTVTR